MKLLIKFVTLLILVSSVNAQITGPKISSPAQVHNFGDIVEGTIVTHEFTITNEGDAELQLIKVSSSCGCTAAKPDKDKLQPGDSTKITVTFKSKSRHGKQKKYIYVFTNDKSNSRYRLIIHSNVINKEEVGAKSTPRMSVSENKHDFGKVKEGSLLTLNLGIKSIGESDLLITDVQTSCGCTAALLSSDKLKPGESGNVRIELDTSGMKGSKTRTLAIRSNDPLNPRYVITLFVEVEN
jgi:hypothetical protein